MKSKPIPVMVSIEGLRTINELAELGQKAKGFNPSPVQIKEQLAAMDSEMLFELAEDTAAIIKANTPIKD